jgi:hypothetical protein
MILSQNAEPQKSDYVCYFPWMSYTFMGKPKLVNQKLSNGKHEIESLEWETFSISPSKYWLHTWRTFPIPNTKNPDSPDSYRKKWYSRPGVIWLTYFRIGKCFKTIIPYFLLSKQWKEKNIDVQRLHFLFSINILQYPAK